jgi:hypothetical protein
MQETQSRLSIEYATAETNVELDLSPIFASSFQGVSNTCTDQKSMVTFPASLNHNSGLVVCLQVSMIPGSITKEEFEKKFDEYKESEIIVYW